MEPLKMNFWRKGAAGPFWNIKVDITSGKPRLLHLFGLRSLLGLNGNLLTHSGLDDDVWEGWLEKAGLISGQVSGCTY